MGRTILPPLRPYRRYWTPVSARLPLVLRSYAHFHVSAIVCLAAASGGGADDSDGGVEK